MKWDYVLKARHGASAVDVEDEDLTRNGAARAPRQDLNPISADERAVSPLARVDKVVRTIPRCSSHDAVRHTRLRLLVKDFEPVKKHGSFERDETAHGQSVFEAGRLVVLTNTSRLLFGSDVSEATLSVFTPS